MDYIPRITIRRAWEDLKEGERSETAEVLKDWFTQLHGIQPPSPPYFGSIDGGPLPDDIFCLPERDDRPDGRPLKVPMKSDGSGPFPKP